MKNKFLLILTLGLISLSMGCDKDPAAVSKIVQELFPIITLKGSEVTVVPPGGTFVDPGASVNPGYTESGDKVDPTAAGSITINADSVVLGKEEGIYFVPYTYRNSNGFQTTVKRKVVVVASAYTANYAGTWKRAATGGIVKFVNLGSGVHEITNPGGVDLTLAANAVFVDEKMYVIIKNDNSVIVPAQTLTASHADVTGLNSISFTPTQVKYAFRAGNGVYGTAVRTFDKI